MSGHANALPLGLRLHHTIMQRDGAQFGIMRAVHRRVSTSRLTSLPPELLLDIFDQLSCPEVWSLRAVNRGLRDFIWKHREGIAGGRLRGHRRRIAARLSDMSTIQHLEPMEALQRHVSYYGVAGMLRHSRGLATRCLSEIYMTPTGTNNAAFASFVDATQARGLFDRCLNWIERRTMGYHPVHLANEEQKDRQWMENNFNPPMVAAIISRLQDQDFWRSADYTSLRGSPRFFLTRKYYNTHPSFVNGERTDLCPHIHEVLDLPEHRRIGSVWPQSKYLAYCVKTHAMAILAQQAEPFNGGRALTSIQKAAIIEEIFVW